MNFPMFAAAAAASQKPADANEQERKRQYAERKVQEIADAKKAKLAIIAAANAALKASAATAAAAPPKDGDETESDEEDDSKVVYYPYDKAFVAALAVEYNFATWSCICDDEAGTTNGACPMCVIADLLLWCCGGCEIHEDHCDFDDEKHAHMDHFKLVRKGFLTKPKWMD